MSNHNYDFNIGDEVITVEGERGTIVDICDCEQCKARGFLEPVWENEEGDWFWITANVVKYISQHFYKIGNYRFGEFDKAGVERHIKYHETSLAKLRRQLKLIEEFEED